MAVNDKIVSKQMVMFSENVPCENIVNVRAQVVQVAAKTDASTEHTLDLNVTEFYLVSPAMAQLPLQIEDAVRPKK